MKVYEIIARQLERQHRCESRAYECQEANYVDASNQVEYCVREYLPSGSGIDSGCQIEEPKYSPAGNLIQYTITTSFHHMNKVGMYDGWTHHNILVKPDWNGFRLIVGGSNRNEIREYLRETFSIALNRDVDLEADLTGSKIHGR